MDSIFSGIQGLGEGCCLIVVAIIVFIVVIAYLLGHKRNKTTITQQSQPNIQMPVKSEQKPDRRCPKCGRSIPFNSVVCPYCKHDFGE